MDLNITINTNKNCQIIIHDNTEYLSETLGTSKGRFKYSDTISLAILQHNKLNNPIIKLPIFSRASSKNLVVPIDFDGWFTINYIVLPNKDWFDRESQLNSGSALELYGLIYYSDGINIFKYNDGKSEIVTIEEIIEVNSENTTISKISLDYIAICFIQKCYVDLCQQILNSRGFSSCWNKNEVSSELIYKRDLVWMAINVIKYLTEANLLSEAERIIEQIISCNGLCKSNASNLSTSSGCNCFK